MQCSKTVAFMTKAQMRFCVTILAYLCLHSSTEANLATISSIAKKVFGGSLDMMDTISKNYDVTASVIVSSGIDGRDQMITSVSIIKNAASNMVDNSIAEMENIASESIKILFCHRGQTNYTEMVIGDAQHWYDSGFDITKYTVILIHGFINNAFSEAIVLIKNAYLLASDVNVVVIEWNWLAFTTYPQARGYVPLVGNYTASLIDWLVYEVGMPLSFLHMVGHSLGAQICGFAGKCVTSGKIPKIIGLDPALPLFTDDITERLHCSDAKFVQVIHTCTGVYGWDKSCAHVDFYPNGGLDPQPGCVDMTGVCSHARAVYYMAESIGCPGFVGKSCDSWEHYKQGLCDNNTSNIMGEYVDPTVHGSFYLHTNSESPFAKW